MSLIVVAKRDGRFVIMVNYIKRASFQSPNIANNEAKKIKTHEMPSAELILA